MLIRRFARKLPVGIGEIQNNPVMKEMENYVKEQREKGKSIKELQREIIGDAQLDKLYSAMMNGGDLDIKKLGIKFPADLEKRLDEKFNSLSEKDQEDILKTPIGGSKRSDD